MDRESRPWQGRLSVPGDQPENDSQPSIKRAAGGALTADHVGLLEAAAIPEQVAFAAGVHSVTMPASVAGMTWSGPGLVFPYHPIDGAPVPQYRPDAPTVDGDGRPRKYLFPVGPVPLNIVPAMRERLDTAERVLFVEGTKQALAAVAHAPADVLVVGIAGCWGWSRDGVAQPDLGRLGIAGRAVVVAFDADLTSNAKVHAAAARLAEHLDLIGAESVRFLTLPASGTVGLDDFLAGQTDPETVLAKLLERADKLGRKPKRAAGPLFDADGIRTEALFEAVTATAPLAIDGAGRIRVYSDGCYRADAHALRAACARLLGDRFRSVHLRSLEDFALGRLSGAGRVIGDESPDGLVNVANGRLDAVTGKLHPHDPDLLDVIQFPVAWDPDATCATFDGWLEEVAGDLADDLLEAVAQLLERRPRRQRRAVFLFGPSHSGKSTLLRIMETIAGPENRSAVTLHELSTDRFAAADLHGSALNSAADLSANHVQDLSLFKMLTGDDPVRAQRKYGQPFTFHSQALFVLSANTVPTVGELSRAFMNRVRPFPFDASFEGREDPGIEDQLMGELAGVLVRLVDAYQRHRARGGYGVSDATLAAADRFAQAADRVSLFLAETCDLDPDGFVNRTTLHTAFETWCTENRRQSMGRQSFYERVESAGYTAVVRQGSRGFRGVQLLDRDDWGAVRPSRTRDFSPSPAPSAPEKGSETAQGAGGAENPQPCPTREANRGERNQGPKGQWSEPAPSAPCESDGSLWDNPPAMPSGDDPGEEYF